MDWDNSGNSTSRPIWLIKNLIITNSLHWNLDIKKINTNPLTSKRNNLEDLNQSLLGILWHRKTTLNVNSSRSKCNRNNYSNHGTRQPKLRRGRWKVISITIKVTKNIKWWRQMNLSQNKIVLSRRIRWILTWRN